MPCISRRWILFSVVSGAAYAILLGVLVLRSYLLSRYYGRSWRMVRILVSVVIIAGTICSIIFLPSRTGLTIKNFIIIVFANFGILVVLTRMLLYWFPSSWRARHIVDLMYRCVLPSGQFSMRLCWKSVVNLLMPQWSAFIFAAMLGVASVAEAVFADRRVPVSQNDISSALAESLHVKD